MTHHFDMTTIIHTNYSLDNHMRRQMDRMVKAGFNDYHRQFVRSALEQAYQQGRSDAMNGRVVENIILKSVITEDVIMQSETA